MPQPTYKQQMQQLTVLARGEYAGRCRQWFNTTFPVLLEGKVADLKRDLQALRTQEEFEKKMKANIGKGGGGGKQPKNRPEPYNKRTFFALLYSIWCSKGFYFSFSIQLSFPPPSTAKGGDKNKGKGGGKKDGENVIRAAMPRMCVPWAWGCCPHNAEDCDFPHERVSKEDYKQMAESKILGPRLRGLKYEDIPTE